MMALLRAWLPAGAVALLPACASIGAGSVNRDRPDYNQALAHTSAVPQAPVITVPANELSQPATPSAAQPDSTAKLVHMGHSALTLARSLTTSDRGEGT
jgi:hypothetical protein